MLMVELIAVSSQRSNGRGEDSVMVTNIAFEDLD